jgi:hypothetical protein
VSPDDGSEAADTVNLWGHCSGSDGTNKPVFHHPGVEERPDEFEHTLIGHSRGDARHQAVVIDSVEKLFEIEIDHDVVALGDVTLRA